MEEENQPYQHHQAVSDEGEDSFFAGSVKSEEEQPAEEEQAEDQAALKHKSRPKKKHINKKRGEKPSKPKKTRSFASTQTPPNNNRSRIGCTRRERRRRTRSCTR